MVPQWRWILACDSEQAETFPRWALRAGSAASGKEPRLRTRLRRQAACRHQAPMISGQQYAAFGFLESAAVAAARASPGPQWSPREADSPDSLLRG